jgi:WD40 repeat protein
VSSVAFSPDGNLVICEKGAWHIADGKKWFELSGHQVVQAANTKIMATFNDKAFLLREGYEGTRLRKLAEAVNFVFTTIALSADGHLAAAGSYWGEIAIWNADTGELTFRSPWLQDQRMVNSLAFSPDGKWLATATEKERVTLWDVSTGLQVRQMDMSFVLGHDDGSDMDFSADGRLLAVASSVGVNVWETATGRLVTELETPSRVYGVAFSPDMQRLAAASRGSSLNEGLAELKIWKISRTSPTHPLQFEPEVALEQVGAVTSLAISPDGQHLAVSTWDSNARVWSLVDGGLEKVFQDQGSVRSVTFSADSESLFYSLDSWTYVRRIQDGKLVARLHPINASLAVSPDGELLAIGGEVYRTADFQPSTTLQYAPISMSSLVFSPNGKWIAGADELSGDVTFLWQLDGIWLRAFHHKTPVTDVTFTPNGDAFVTASRNGMVRFWDPENAQLIRALEAAPGGASALSFSPDGRLLACAGKNGQITLWSYPELSLLQTLKGHSLIVTGLGFTPDGAWLVSSSEDGTIRIWGVPGG